MMEKEKSSFKDIPDQDQKKNMKSVVGLSKNTEVETSFRISKDRFYLKILDFSSDERQATPISSSRPITPSIPIRVPKINLSSSILPILSYQNYSYTNTDTSTDTDTGTGIGT